MNYTLSSLDSYEFEKHRKVEFIKSILINEKEAWVIKVSPNVIGQKYGLNDRDIDYLIISPRHKGVSLSKIDKYPCFVYIARFLNNQIPRNNAITSSEVEIIAWGELYQSE